MTLVYFRLKQILHWCGDDFDGCIVFDECHKAKNLCPTGAGKPTKTGQTVLELQNKLPKARVVYASATGNRRRLLLGISRVKWTRTRDFLYIPPPPK